VSGAESLETLRLSISAIRRLRLSGLQKTSRAGPTAWASDTARDYAADVEATRIASNLATNAPSVQHG